MVALEAMSKGSKKLEILDLSGTTVTDAGLLKLKLRCPRLVEVNTARCSNAVSGEGKTHLLSTRQNRSL